MNITSGTRLGPYEIVSRIGAGGMGEVWRARDVRLDRTVAVKVLPQELAHSAQLRLRFEREARAISQLNHPHICTLHDVGEEGGRSYLALVTARVARRRGVTPAAAAVAARREVRRARERISCAP